ncbi:DUF805 domain-containing protein [Uliginosibacterium paludis]|uniref:DUF805 domain-containing protein n=1 Tax=Uliginosibacterium paludis TaxID=1615952 RepID=A0ABV2CTT1_9RHOO
MNSILHTLRHGMDFRGRASRSEYWIFHVAGMLVLFAVCLLSVLLPGELAAWLVRGLAACLLLPSLAVSVRRMHDTGRSGWSVLMPALPCALGALVFSLPGEPGLLWILPALLQALGIALFLIMAAQRGEDRANSFGPAWSWCAD